MSDPIEVHITCACPGTPHAEGDTVNLRPKLGLADGTTLQSQLRSDIVAAGSGKVNWDRSIGMLMEGYLLVGIVGWSLLDAEGKPLPVSEDAIRERLLDDFALAKPIGDVADDLYFEPVLAPLLKQLAESLTSSQTSKSTSATKKSATSKAKPRSPSTRRSSKRPTLLKPSSTSTTQTDYTATTSVELAGASTG
jgi:hypothetical protein